ncbi:SDR family oxidoreductase [Cytobacillus spongiae]|uniref:SDR family oxidoreductase n=1 Tax=Cytobacillus spongiae TaxID=2901381 RepID=UPI001F45E68A|nr:SDR family oxidoreductase [Cytobacillus spongiae]UII56639.1 SDR family oxidoreductase [Cytobacillus spongiae]
MKSIIVTGAGSGLGKELSLKLAKEGYHIIVAGRNLSKLQKVQHEIGEEHAHAVTIDIQDLRSVKDAIDELSKSFEIHGLVNNAGVGYFGPFIEQQEKDIQEMLQTNIAGTMYMTQAVLPILSKNKKGFLMNIISTAGLRGKVNEAVYVASKFAVRGFTESIQKEYEQQGIHISAVYMGGMNTPFWDHNDHIADRTRLRSPEEVAEIILANRSEPSIIIESSKP